MTTKSYIDGPKENDQYGIFKFCPYHLKLSFKKRGTLPLNNKKEVPTCSKTDEEPA